MILERRAYAKVNLILSVGPPQATDGGLMHPIASWMHGVDLYDTVRLEWLGEHHPMRFEIGWASDAPRQSPIDWPREKDLGMRALRLMEQAAGKTLPVSIRIEKRIPVGGGLGGGSSDAAAVMCGIRDLLSLRMTDLQLCGLSARLGSDTAFFVGASPPAPAVVRGMGDRIERVERGWAGREIVLIVPGFGCATGPVYKAYDQLGPRALLEVVPGRDLFNDLDAAAERVRPELVRLRAAVEQASGLAVHMSGSGSTLFVLPADNEGGGEGAGRDLAGKIGREVSDISVLATRLI